MKYIIATLAVALAAACGSGSSTSTVTVTTGAASSASGKCSAAVRNRVSTLFGKTAKPTVEIGMGVTPPLVTKATIAHDKAIIRVVIQESTDALKSCPTDPWAKNAQKSIGALKTYL
jgi:hypothetical protein